MGQQLSKSRKLRGCPSSSADSSTLSKPSQGVLRAVTKPFSDDGSSQTTASSQDSHRQQQPSPEDAVASARAFFDATVPSRLSFREFQGSSEGALFTNSRSPRKSPQRSQTLRVPSNPVKCPGAIRQEGAPGDLVGLGNDEDFDDQQNLTRLYERRTWEMFILITEARKHQRYNGASYSESNNEGETLPLPDGTHPGQDPGTMLMSPNHDMIFSCDFE